jgi:predicted DNA repair protein MutK
MSTGLLALLDDVTSMLDDIAVMVKQSTTKAVGVAGDDSLVNAEQVSSMRATGEIRIVGKIALGSLINKAILVPACLLISYFTPWLLTALLIVGGLYLCYEGAEKVLHAHQKHEAKHPDSKDLPVDVKERIKGAIRTDFVLSAEILVIALGEMVGKPFTSQAIALSVVGIIMTIAVYGIVAFIVKIDDFGLWLASKKSAAAKRIGTAIVEAVPIYMRGLAIAGTMAMLVVGGDILSHNIPLIHHWMENLHAFTGLEGWKQQITGLFASCSIAYILGVMIIAVQGIFQAKFKGTKASSS